jgi:hypothetical protein
LCSVLCSVLAQFSVLDPEEGHSTGGEMSLQDKEKADLQRLKDKAHATVRARPCALTQNAKSETTSRCRIRCYEWGQLIP